MNGNKARAQILSRYGLVLAVFACLLAPVGSRAAEKTVTATAPAMSGVQEVLLQYAKIGNNAKAGACTVTPGEITSALYASLKSYNVPAVSVIDAKPAMIGVARIELIPEIVSLNSQGVDCTSWVSLVAQTQNTLRIQPIETPRSVIVTYWRGGMLVNSNQTTHPHAIKEAFEKLSSQFSQQYKLDQPPELPNLDAPPADAKPDMAPANKPGGK
jgi:hypothetical protein